MQKLPRWLEALIIKALKDFLPPSVIKDTFVGWKEDVLAQLRVYAADTSNKIDDRIVDMVDQALSTCEPDAQWMCDLVANGKAVVIAKLRELAASTETKLDDAAVDILEEAMK